MSRTAPDPKIRLLAQRLAAFDAVSNGSSPAAMPTAFRVVDKLARPLGTLAGPAGFRSILTRSLTLATGKNPRLSAVQVKPDGSLQGLSDLGDQTAEAGVALITELLGLLAAFIGEGLMLSVLLDVWPEFPVADMDHWIKDHHDPAS